MDPFAFQYCLDNSDKLTERSSFEIQKEIEIDISQIEFVKEDTIKEKETEKEPFGADALNSKCQSQIAPTPGISAEKMEYFNGDNSFSKDKIHIETQMMEAYSPSNEGCTQNYFNNGAMNILDSGLSEILNFAFERIKQRQELIDAGQDYI